LPSAAADRCHAAGRRRAARPAHQEAHPYFIRATGGRFASPMSSALKMHAEACEQQPSYASRANVKVPELNVYFVFVSPLTVVHV
jgi:hypothetical protein